MKETWRMLETGYHTAAENMAIDYAILKAHSEGLVLPTIRFYGWSPPAISIGYFQRLNEEIDMEACKREGVSYVRRITGGGAVFHEDEVTYSCIVSEKNPKISHQILESYDQICGAIIKGLEELDIHSSFAPINDIVVNGKKISGNAQTRKMKTVLQHGTILLDVDVEKMFSILKVPNEKIKDKMISNVKERVTSLSHVLSEPPSFTEVIAALKTGFEGTFDIILEEGLLTSEEEEYSKIFEQKNFSNPTWNHLR